MSIEQQFLQEFWKSLRGSSAHISHVEFAGSYQGLPSKYLVAPFASAAVAAATLAVAELWQARRGAGSMPPVVIDRTHACASYLCDQLAKPQGGSFEDDPGDISGNYQTADGWLRIHAMYQHHRIAALKALDFALDSAPDRDVVASKIRSLKKFALESVIVENGGCAAELRSPREWENHPQGAAVALEPLFSYHGEVSHKRRFLKEKVEQDLPLAGLRVLDLTRVLAGPIGARFLAAYGADVIRIDPIGFYESNALLIETARGKRTLGLDLKSRQDQVVFENLLRNADVLIHGYRPGAMERLGFTSKKMAEINPGIVIVRHNAYGWSGPWSDRRGFDSLVQMSCGIAFTDAGSKPKPLPAQALDYTTGYLIAAAACRGLLEKNQETRLSLARTAIALTSKGHTNDLEIPAFKDLRPFTANESSDWGNVSQLKCPGHIGNVHPNWKIPAGKIGKNRELSWSYS
jgi:crotonobetainyl-CoA:carnitine CoA-transferase CaiB-like acyl-CoA transferase